MTCESMSAWIRKRLLNWRFVGPAARWIGTRKWQRTSTIGREKVGSLWLTQGASASFQDRRWVFGATTRPEIARCGMILRLQLKHSR